MSELSLLIEPSTALPADRIDALTAGLADDLRTVRGLRITYAQSPADGHGKSQQAWELGMLVVGGLFSATTMRALAQIAIAYADRIKARSIMLRSGDNELVITGATRVDPQLVDQLAGLLAGPSATTTGSTTAALAGPTGNGVSTGS
ncbi:hypothetical protein GA0070624_2146 [Micromonospora rhizosphaerae]|uniref:Uncharacterized protein n=1 Tax=Micromonospora rhizosphaerae TaxID=568872 RepID=A0A1C6RUN4_9ACTN|nr:hypothetical protein [Micromonospora rhizosphaerae]SCL20875.1 hypothetical protein GA0070624_2146 [Micromonospora rhizosphaerae]